jgi:hypothetical protein
VHPHALLIGIVLAGLAAVAGIQPVLRPAPVDAQAEDAAQIRDLAERLLTPTSPMGFAMGGGEAPRAQIHVGRLPADFPLALPIPPGGRLVGSAQRGMSGDVANVDVAIEAPGTPAQILSFYDAALPAAGLYLAPNSYGSSGGFQPGAAKRSESYCLSEAGPWINVSATERGGGQTDVRASVTLQGPSTGSPATYMTPCSTDTRRGYPGTTSRLLPRVSGPSGVPLQSSGISTMGDDYAMSSVVANTDMGVVDLERFFAQQVEAAGWTLRTRGAEGPVAWSTWTLPESGEYAGFLYALEAPGEQRKRLTLQAESASGGMTSPMYYPFSLGR